MRLRLCDNFSMRYTKTAMNGAHGLPHDLDRTAIMLRLARAYHATVAAFEQHAEIAAPRWRLLYLVNQLGTCTQKQLIALIKVDPGSITRQIKQLERDGYIVRASDPDDNRLTRVRLSAAGKVLVRRTMIKRRQFLDRMLAGISPAQVEAFLATMTRIERNLDGSDGGDGHRA